MVANAMRVKISSRVARDCLLTPSQDSEAPFPEKHLNGILEPGYAEVTDLQLPTLPVLRAEKAAYTLLGGRQGQFFLTP